MKVRRRAETPQLSHWNYLRRHVCGDAGDRLLSPCNHWKLMRKRKRRHPPLKRPLAARLTGRAALIGTSTWPALPDDLRELKARDPPHRMSHEDPPRSLTGGAEANLSKSVDQLEQP